MADMKQHTLPELLDEIVARMDLNEEKADKFRSDVYKCAGWKPSTSWVPPTDKDSDSKPSSGWFKE